ncbi:MAG: DnaJ domain-containing protein [bacterium]
MDPYQILGITPDATDDEVKKAYRQLAKKYHPDANVNSPYQEAYTEKFKQVQNAYKMIMDARKNGTSFNGYQGYGSQNQYGYQGSNGQTQYGYNQGYNQNTYSGQGSYSDEQRQYMNIDSLLRAGRFQEAWNNLESIRTRSDVWFYYAALAQNGLGNNIQAREFAKTAYSMNPQNLQYIFLMQQLGASSQRYNQQRSQYGYQINPASCCYTYLLMQCCMTCCCGCR